MPYRVCNNSFCKSYERRRILCKIIEIMGCSLEASNHIRNFVPTAIMIEFALFQQASTFEMYVNEFTLPQRVELCLNNRIRTLEAFANDIHQEYPCAPAA